MVGNFPVLVRLFEHSIFLLQLCTTFQPSPFTTATPAHRLAFDDGHSLELDDFLPVGAAFL